VGNNDVLFPNDFYQRLIQNKNLFFKYPVISPDIITTDGFHQNPHVIKKISKFREIIYDLYHSNYQVAKIILMIASLSKKITSRRDILFYDHPREIYQGYGACYILTPLFFKNFKQLDSPTFLMYEEYFLSLQLKNKGFKIYYEPSISLKHLMHATTNKLPGKLKWQFSRESHKLHRRTNKIFNK
jgi:GT2 family glycosyltransferase